MRICSSHCSLSRGGEVRGSPGNAPRYLDNYDRAQAAWLNVWEKQARSKLARKVLLLSEKVACWFLGNWGKSMIFVSNSPRDLGSIRFQDRIISSLFSFLRSSSTRGSSWVTNNDIWIGYFDDYSFFFNLEFTRDLFVDSRKKWLTWYRRSYF